MKNVKGYERRFLHMLVFNRDRIGKMYPFGFTKSFKRLGRLASIALIVSAMPTMPLHAAVEAHQLNDAQARNCEGNKVITNAND